MILFNTICSTLQFVMKIIYVLFCSILLFSCFENNHSKVEEKPKKKLDTIIKVAPKIIEKEVVVSDLELKLIAAGLVDIQAIDSTIYIDVKYSTTDNFMNMDLYGDFDKAYLQKEVAEKLTKAQQYLKEEFPNYSLLVYDGVRPRHVQQMMWDSLKIPVHEKTKFVSNPKNGSIHNYGAAVDLTIVNENQEILDMATPYDFIGKLAYPRLEQDLLAKGEITQEQINNRALLRKVMKKAGFFGIQTEWWHFNSCSRKEAKMNYEAIE